MNRTAVIHIGHGKTGTSYIQSCLALNRDRLSNLGISYPYDSSIEFAMKGGTTSGNGALFQSNYLPTSEDAHQILFSSEILFHSLIDDGGLTLKNLLSNKYNNVKIILYTRDVLDMLVSTWGQLVKKMGATIGLNDYIQSRKDRHHEKVISWINLSKKMGFELEMRNYSRCKGNLLETFYDCLGLNELQTKKFLIPQYKIINRSLSSIELESLRIINKSMPSLGSRISDKLITECRDFIGINSKVSVETLDIVELHYEKIISQINEYLPDTGLLEIGDIGKYVEKGDDFLSLTGKQVEVFASEITKFIGSKNIDRSSNDLKALQEKNREFSNALRHLSEVIDCCADDVSADSLFKLKFTSPGEQRQIINSIRNLAYRIEENKFLEANELEILDDIVVILTSPRLFEDLGIWNKLEVLRGDILCVVEKARSGTKLDLSDALLVMKVALALRPNGPAIMQKVEEYEKRLEIQKFD